jgi:hypothetical protein
MNKYSHFLVVDHRYWCVSCFSIQEPFEDALDRVRHVDHHRIWSTKDLPVLIQGHKIHITRSQSISKYLPVDDWTVVSISSRFDVFRYSMIEHYHSKHYLRLTCLEECRAVDGLVIGYLFRRVIDWITCKIMNIGMIF